MGKEIIEQVKRGFSADSVREQFRNALKENADIFQAGVIELVTSDKYLQQCDTASILTSALALASLRLPINKSLGFAYLVPYKNTCQPQIGYKGLIQLAQRTGLYKCINAGPVFEGELKSVDKLSGEIDITGEKKSDNIIGYFAYFSTNYGFSKSLYWTKEQVEKHAKRFSQSYRSKSGPWASDFDAMACKTVLKSLISHYGPMTIDIGNSIAKTDGEDLPDGAFDIEIEATPDPLEAMAAEMKMAEAEKTVELSHDEIVSRLDSKSRKDLEAQFGPSDEWNQAVLEIAQSKIKE